MSNIDILKKLRLYKTNPSLVQEMTPNEIADIALLVMSQVNLIDKAIKEGRLDGKTPQPDKDYMSRESALKMLSNAVNDMVSRVDNELGAKGSQLDKAVSEAITRLQNGKDGIVTEAEIERAATLALSMLELPDFDALVTEQITSNSNAIRDALELLTGENRYKVEIADVQGLEKLLNELAQIRTANGGTIGKQQVYGFIRQAIADGVITTGSSLPDQTGNNGKFLTTNGTDAAWAALAGGGDMLAANNLSDVASDATAVHNLLDNTSLTAAIVAGTDKVIIQDTDDTNVLKTVTAQSIANLNAGVADGDKGDITVSASGATWTIDNKAVTLAKMDDMATGSLIYRKTALAGAPEVQSLATLKSDLGLTGTNSGDQTTIAGITGTKAQFDTAVTDGNFLYVGDVTTNATHTGEVTGATTLTLDKTAVSNRTDTVITASDVILFGDATDTGNLKKDTVQGILDLVPAAGNVSKVGTPVNDQLAVWTGDGTLEGDASITTAGSGALVLTRASDAADGPSLTLYHNSASPAANDVIGSVYFDARDSGTGLNSYAVIKGMVTSPTGTSEQGQINLALITGGTLADRVTFYADRVVPVTNDAYALGSTTNQFSDLFLAEGAVINWDNGDATLTQTGNVVKLAGAALETDGNIELGHASDTTIARVSAGVASIEGNNIVTNTSSPTLATITTTGNIELGNASDTTLSRSAAGVIAVEGVVIPSISSTNTLTNKRVTPRVLSATSYTTDTGTSLNADNYDIFSVTAQAGALLFNAPGGTPTDGQKLIITVASSTTSARALTWNAIFEASTVALPTTTAATTAQLNIGFMYSAGRTKWVCIAVA